jgi:Domain of unknown function (DUF4872)/Butirosin biosynthesis protein H, N-terminal
MIIENLPPYNGQHCETTTTGTLLSQLNIHLSEPMLFGLGEGLGYIFWKLKVMNLPFIGGRIKPDALTANIAKNLCLELTVNETSSKSKAWEEVKTLIDSGKAVGLKLDCFHLEYFARPFHFAGHYAAIYGYDEKDAYMIDTAQQNGKNKTSLESLAKARAEKGPMSSKNLYYTISKSNKCYGLKSAILTAIKNNATDYLNPPISNIGYKGIHKTSIEVMKWFNNSQNIEKDFKMTAMLMEKAGTGGAIFRNLYRDFLAESYEILQLEALYTAHQAFVEIAELWTRVAQIFVQISQTQEFQYVQEASVILKELSIKEKQAMEGLLLLPGM